MNDNAAVLRSLNATLFARVAFVFGIAALAIGGLGASSAFVAASAASGCGVMVRQLLGIAALTLALLGVPHLIASTLYLRGAPNGRQFMVALCVFNIVVNLVIALLFVVNGPANLSLAWWVLLALNAVGFSIYRSGRAPSA
jgi:hypothetical protein